MRCVRDIVSRHLQWWTSHQTTLPRTTNDFVPRSCLFVRCRIVRGVGLIDSPIRIQVVTAPMASAPITGMRFTKLVERISDHRLKIVLLRVTRENPRISAFGESGAHRDHRHFLAASARGTATPVAEEKLTHAILLNNRHPFSIEYGNTVRDW